MKFAEERTSRDVDALQGFLDDSIKEGTEGLIVKVLVLPLRARLFSGFVAAIVLFQC